MFPSSMTGIGRAMRIGDIVKYRKPQSQERDIRFILRELNGDRVLIELICDYRIKPLETVSTHEVCLADD